MASKADVIHDVAFDGQFVLNYETIEKTTKTKMPTSPVYFFFDLIRFNKKVEEIVHSPEKWLFLVKNSAKLSAMPKEFSGDSAVESYFSASRLAKFSPEENDQYNSDMRNEWDIANEKAFIKKEGHAEGFAKGIAKGREEGRKEGREEGKADEKLKIGVPPTFAPKVTIRTQNSLYPAPKVTTS